MIFGVTNITRLPPTRRVSASVRFGSSPYFSEKGFPPTDEQRAADAQDYRCVRDAMDVLGLTAEEQDAVYRVVAGILHFQSIGFATDREGTAVLPPEARDVVEFVASDLWRVDAEGLRREVTLQTTALYTRPLTKEQALDARDGISKVLYKEMFEWLIAKMNTLLSSEGEPGHWLGLLDIFGFENFETNSFEQLCINYANEQLQNHYNSIVFARDMREYQREGVAMTHINPPDNTPCLELLGSKEKMGLFTLLDDQSKAQGGSDQKFLESVRERHYQRRREHPNLVLPRIKQAGSTTFTVRHFAADVEYSVRGFQTKNMDPLADTVQRLFHRSSCAFIQQLLPQPADAPLAKGKKVRTVAGFFKDSMGELMDTINQTNPFWIRCVKPHHAKRKHMFHGNEVMMQLRSAGILETVKIRQCGYPWRLAHEDFWLRFKILLAKEDTGRRPLPSSQPSIPVRTGILLICRFQVPRCLCRSPSSFVFGRDLE